MSGLTWSVGWFVLRIY